ncbi:MAG: oxygen-independent coproporphyrinogen III oxidase [Alphaproteobacteria bacterium]|nr:oxygen-independent coproporphyrinogen III oxidase [Alphaproteobacteria bacterium]
MRADLAASYGEERLPRYTSYPTAPHFSPAVNAEVYGQWLGEIPAGLSASLYLHVPFCREMCWYCGCHTQIVRRDDLIESYRATLVDEIELVAGRIGRRLAVDHIHFGGGTPTILSPQGLVDLMALIRRAFALHGDTEIAVEIDPRTLSRDMVNALREGGVNRASIGVQSFDARVQTAINRVQSFEQTSAVTADLRQAGISGINIDLIYGLPHQTLDSCISTVRQCLDLQPERFSVFGYAHVPGFKKHQSKISEADLPDSPARHQQSSAIAEALIAAGYVQIGLDHFATADDAMAVAFHNHTLRRNFQGYTTDTSEVLLGFGASAIGCLPQGYVQNEVPIGGYAEAIAAGRLATVKGLKLHDDDRLRGAIIERIMCDFGVDLDAVCARHNVAPEAVLASAPRLENLIRDGVVTLTGNRLTVSPDSRFLLRNVAAAFDAYLDSSKRLHSRAV